MKFMRHNAHRFLRTHCWRFAVVSCVAVLLTATPMHAQSTGSLTGTVLVDSVETPLANAEIVFPVLKMSARSDENGNFQISNLPAGAHEVVVRLVGYEPYNATITFRPAQKVDAEFLLQRSVAKLAKVNVKAAADSRYAIRLHDFEERRKFGFGRFLTADAFENTGGRNLADILISKIPSVKTTGKWSEQWLYSSRYGQACYVQVIVNGMVRYGGREAYFDINSILADQVIGVEYYSTATTPMMFSATGAAGCGTIIIWTK